MSLSPLYVGETHIIWSLTWKDDSGTAINLTNAVLTGILQRLGQNPTLNDITLAGTFTITNAVNGTFTYTPVAGDLAVAGSYLIQVIATYNDGTVLHSDPIALTIKAVL